MGYLALGRIMEFLIVCVSLAVFSILDLVDPLLCVVFWALDSILDSETTPCYCKNRIGGAFPQTQGPTLSKNAHKCGSDSATSDVVLANAEDPSPAKHVYVSEDSPSQPKQNDGAHPSANVQCSSCLPEENGKESRDAASFYTEYALPDRPAHAEYIHGIKDNPSQSEPSQDHVPFCTNGCPSDAKHVRHGQPAQANQGRLSYFKAVHDSSRDCLLNGEDAYTNGNDPSYAKHVLGREDHPPLAEEAICCQERLSPIHAHSGNRGSSVPGSSSELLRPILSRWSDCGCSTCTSWHSDEKELLYVHTEGKGHENVVFIHGFLSSSALWAGRVIPHLPSEARASHRLFAVDLLGFGKSPKPRSSLYTMADHIKRIEESVLHRYKIDSFHIVAHSMGCIVALALAAAHVDSVKTITLIAPPYFQAPENESGASYVLRQLAPRRIWPPLAFGASVMSWYEHVGRGLCFLLCKQHFFWEWVLSILTLNRISRFAVCDFMQHTHHSAWHIFHNVICAEAHAMDSYLSILEKGNCEIHVIHGNNDSVVPIQCSYQLQEHLPNLELEVLEGANHFTVIFGREKALALELEKIWEERKHQRQFIGSIEL